METIGLYKTTQCWMSRCKTNLKAFGQMDIPTAFTVAMPAETVLAKIKALNPNCNVMLIHG